MKGISLILSSVKQKSGKKRSRRKKPREKTKQDENLVVESEGNMPKKKMKKIRIRLADPNIPDSYICEVFDSSLEQDEGGTDTEKREIQKKSFKSSIMKEKSKSKPKDYFDVLMSKESRTNVKLNTAFQSKELKKSVRDSESDELLTSSKIRREKRKGKLVEMISNLNNSNEYSNSTSDDESLFQVQSKVKLNSSNSKPENSSSEKVGSAKNKKNNEKDKDMAREESRLFPANATHSIKKNKTNILNYFSKTEPRKTSGNGQVKIMKYPNIKPFDKTKSVNMGHIVRDDSKSVRRDEVIKLAPLFQKKTKKVIDPKIQKARLEFLQNGLPAIMKKMCNERKNMEVKYSSFLFPVVSHVQQRDDDPMWSPEDLWVPYLKATEENDDELVAKKTFRFEICESSAKNLDDTKKQSLNLGNLRLKYRDLNVDFIFKSFKEKRESFLKKMENNSFNGTKNTGSGFARFIDDREGCNSLWTEVYRPKSSEIIGNKQTVKELSGWLKSWKEYSYKVMDSSVKVETKVLDSTDVSDDDLFSSKDEDLRLQAPKNICLLSGPIGSGKTTLVYALASELDYSVLEVNASSKRTGKKLLLDLQEATKSHEVSSGFGPSTESKRKQPKTRTVKSKKKKIRKENETMRNVQSNSKISLILIEDADIYFEDHDEGFVSAIYTLVQSTKRPFIFLSNDPNYRYLERFKMDQALMLEMRRPDFQNSCAVLDVMAILEGVNVEKEALGNLIRNNQYDLRKSILELQFWIQSGKNFKQHKLFELGKFWWGLNKFLFMKDSVHRLKLNYRKRKRTNDLYDSSSGEEETLKKAKLSVGNVKMWKSQPYEKKIDPSIHACSKILDSVSVTDLFKLGSDPEPIPWNEFRPKDGLSLNECMESVDWKFKNLSKSIAKELITVSTNFFVNSCRDRCKSEHTFCSPPWEETIWRNMHQKARFDLMSLVPSNIGFSQRILNLDYLPILRNICRTEKMRYHGNAKRKNRFCHYFRSLGFNPRDDSLDISCDILEY